MKSPSQEEVSVIADANNNNNKVQQNHMKGERNGEKYSLRQRHKRLASAKGFPSTKLAMSPEIQIKGKTKSKTAPLSKYRRKTANARERTRMREINFAFEKLRRCVPQSVNNDDEQNLSNEKLTKITTLRLAMKYIKTLTEALNTSNNYDIISFMNENSNNCCRDEDDNITGNRLCNVLDNNIGKSVNRVVEMNNGKITEKFKCRTREKRKNQLENSDFLSLTLESQNVGVVLESDGESLPLSESCFSPFSQSIKSTENNLALNVLLDSDNDSVQFSEPSALSPLTCLESFNPFPDLLHTEFAISSSFDLYLT